MGGISKAGVKGKERAKKDLVVGNTGNVGANTKDYQKSSQAQALLADIARKANITTAHPQADSPADSPATGWSTSMLNLLPSLKSFRKLVKPIKASALRLWNYEDARLERVEREWRAEIKRAEEAQAAREAHNRRMEALTRERKPILKHKLISAPYTTALVDVKGSEHTIATAAPITLNKQDSAAGSIWSNSKVPPPPPSTLRPIPKGDILPQITPNPPCLANNPLPRAASNSVRFSDLITVKYATSSEGSASVASNSSLDVAEVTDSDSSSSSASDYAEDEIFSQRSKSRSSVTTSPSPTGYQTSTSKHDFTTPDADGMLLYGRWRHHKDAPLSHIKEMLYRDLRGDPCSLFASGMMKLEDHPLLPIYRTRVEAERKQNSDVPLEPPFSPILMSGGDVSDRVFSRFAIRDSFTRTETGTFKTVGFQMRTASIGSTIASSGGSTSSSHPTSSNIDSAVDLRSHTSASASKDANRTTSPKPATRITRPSLKSTWPLDYDDEPVEPLTTSSFNRKLFMKEGLCYPEPQAYHWGERELQPFPIPVAFVSRAYINEYCRDEASNLRTQDRKITHVKAEEAENPFWASDEEEEEEADEAPQDLKLGAKVPIKIRQAVTLRAVSRQQRSNFLNSPFHPGNQKLDRFEWFTVDASDRTQTIVTAEDGYQHRFTPRPRGNMSFP